MFLSSNIMPIVLHGFDWEATLQEVLYMGSPWESRNVGSLKLWMRKEEVKTDYSHLVKKRAWGATQGNYHFSKFTENRRKYLLMQRLVKLWISLTQAGKKKKDKKKPQTAQISQAKSCMAVQLHCQVWKSLNVSLLGMVGGVWRWRKYCSVLSRVLHFFFLSFFCPRGDMAWMALDRTTVGIWPRRVVLVLQGIRVSLQQGKGFM